LGAKKGGPATEIWGKVIHSRRGGGIFLWKENHNKKEGKKKRESEKKGIKRPNHPFKKVDYKPNESGGSTKKKGGVVKEPCSGARERQ